MDLPVRIVQQVVENVYTGSRVEIRKNLTPDGSFLAFALAKSLITDVTKQAITEKPSAEDQADLFIGAAKHSGGATWLQLVIEGLKEHSETRGNRELGASLEKQYTEKLHAAEQTAGGQQASTRYDRQLDAQTQSDRHRPIAVGGATHSRPAEQLRNNTAPVTRVTGSAAAASASAGDHDDGGAQCSAHLEPVISTISLALVLVEDARLLDVPTVDNHFETLSLIGTVCTHGDQLATEPLTCTKEQLFFRKFSSRAAARCKPNSPTKASPDLTAELNTAFLGLQRQLLPLIKTLERTGVCPHGAGLVQRLYDELLLMHEVLVRHVQELVRQHVHIWHACAKCDGSSRTTGESCDGRSRTTGESTAQWEEDPATKSEQGGAVAGERVVRTGAEKQVPQLGQSPLLAPVTKAPATVDSDSADDYLSAEEEGRAENAEDEDEEAGPFVHAERDTETHEKYRPTDFRPRTAKGKGGDLRCPRIPEDRAISCRAAATQSRGAARPDDSGTSSRRGDGDHASGSADHSAVMAIDRAKTRGHADIAGAAGAGFGDTSDESNNVSSAALKRTASTPVVDGHGTLQHHRRHSVDVEPAPDGAKRPAALSYTVAAAETARATSGGGSPVYEQTRGSSTFASPSPTVTFRKGLTFESSPGCEGTAAGPGRSTESELVLSEGEVLYSMQLQSADSSGVSDCGRLSPVIGLGTNPKELHESSSDPSGTQIDTEMSVPAAERSYSMNAACPVTPELPRARSETSPVVVVQQDPHPEVVFGGRDVLSRSRAQTDILAPACRSYQQHVVSKESTESQEPVATQCICFRFKLEHEWPKTVRTYGLILVKHNIDLRCSIEQMDVEECDSNPGEWYFVAYVRSMAVLEDLLAPGKSFLVFDKQVEPIVDNCEVHFLTIVRCRPEVRDAAVKQVLVPYGKVIGHPRRHMSTVNGSSVDTGRYQVSIALCESSELQGVKEVAWANLRSGNIRPQPAFR